ncbi:MAG: hypothetical protein AVDCRST_MAG66-812, partial [uncultured Pseudonocardia sp.]
ARDPVEHAAAAPTRSRSVPGRAPLRPHLGTTLWTCVREPVDGSRRSGGQPV